MNTVKVIELSNEGNYIKLEHNAFSINFPLTYVKLKTKWKLTILSTLCLPIPIYLTELLEIIYQLNGSGYEDLYTTEFIVNEYLPEFQQNLAINKDLEKTNLL